MKTDRWRRQSGDRDRQTSDRGEKRGRGRKQEGAGEGRREMCQCAGRKRCLKTLGTVFEVCIFQSLSEFRYELCTASLLARASTNCMYPPEQSYCRSQTCGVYFPPCMQISNPVPFNFPNPVTHECPLSCNIVIHKI